MLAMVAIASGLGKGGNPSLANNQEGAIPKPILRIANAATVRIVTPGEPGSGVVVRSESGSCTLLTAFHVVASLQTGENAGVHFASGHMVEFDRAMVTRADQTDFATVTLPRPCPVQHVAVLANPNDAAIGDRVFVSGFSANVSPEVENASYRVRAGRLLSLSEQRDGYSLTYDVDTVAGMSGGPIFASNATLIGVHGRGETLGFTGQKIAAMGMSVRLAKPSSNSFTRGSSWGVGAPAIRNRCPGVVC